jgi:hypothetical protein
MVFWTGIVVGGLFVWLAVRMGFYETWAMLFNVVVAVYTAVFLTPVIVSKIPAAGDTAYGNALTLTAVAAAVFLVLHGISYIFLTGQFKVAFPKVLDLVGAGVLGFLAGVLVWSFVALLVSVTPIAQSSLAQDIGFGRKIEQAQGAYICWWCNRVNAVASPGGRRQPAQKNVRWLLDKAEQKSPGKTLERPEPDNAGSLKTPPARQKFDPEDI